MGNNNNSGPSLLGILGTGGGDADQQDKATKELESIMKADTSDWSQMTIKVKSKFRGYC